MSLSSVRLRRSYGRALAIPSSAVLSEPNTWDYGSPGALSGLEVAFPHASGARLMPVHTPRSVDAPGRERSREQRKSPLAHSRTALTEETAVGFVGEGRHFKRAGSNGSP